jgi:ketosteroid isomerase-like protein
MTFTQRITVATTLRTDALKSIFLLFFVVVSAATPARAQQSDNEKAVWKLETAYWEDVKSLDLKSYMTLWHENVIGWPYGNSQPARIDHIADWITRYTDKGLRLQWFSIQQAASQSTGDLVVTHFWLTSFWADKGGHGEPSTQRITHTWIKTDKSWQIIGGMSAPIPAN